jgi:hypothetical protein
VTSRLGTGMSLTLFYSVSCCCSRNLTDALVRPRVYCCPCAVCICSDAPGISFWLFCASGVDLKEGGINVALRP